MFGIYTFIESINFFSNNYFSTITKIACNGTIAILGGSLLSIYIVANVYPFLNKKYNKKNKDTKIKEIINYQLLYYDEFEDLENNEYEKNDLKNFKFKETIEKTPNGKVIMIYNVESESFWYYTNYKNMSYIMLDTVARKFSIDNNCKNICINYRSEYRKGEEELKENESENNKFKNDKKNVYVKLKEYNTKENEKEKKCILTKKSNRFTYKGKIDDFYYTPPEKTHKQISYKNFKNIDKQ